MKVHLIRCQTLTWKTPVWILFDEKRTMRGRPKTNRLKLQRQWDRLHGAITHITRYRGICSAAEVAMAISEIQNPHPKQPEGKE